MPLGHTHSTITPGYTGPHLEYSPDGRAYNSQTGALMAVHRDYLRIQARRNFLRDLPARQAAAAAARRAQQAAAAAAQTQQQRNQYLASRAAANTQRTRQPIAKKLGR